MHSSTSRFLTALTLILLLVINLSSIPADAEGIGSAGSVSGGAIGAGGVGGGGSGSFGGASAPGGYSGTGGLGGSGTPGGLSGTGGFGGASTPGGFGGTGGVGGASTPGGFGGAGSFGGQPGMVGAQPGSAVGTSGTMLVPGGMPGQVLPGTNLMPGANQGAMQPVSQAQQLMQSPQMLQMQQQQGQLSNPLQPQNQSPQLGMQGLQPGMFATPGGESSSIERTMMDSANDAEKSTPQEFKVKDLKQFGYNFFRPDTQGFAALTDIPVGPDYVLGSGDRVILTAWGSLDGAFELEVNRNGEIVLPKVGAVKVSGTSFGQLPKLLTGLLSKVFRDFQINVTMGKLRMIKVYVVGEVKNPGDYSISSLSTLINALSAAGGPTFNGSLRTIFIKRNGKMVEMVDLYDFFLKGDKSRDIRLQNGDTIFVPVIGPIIGIAGNVRRQAIYELKDEKNLKEAFALADGITPSGYLQRIQITRIEANEKKIVTDIYLGSKDLEKSQENIISSTIIKDRDLVKVFPIDGNLRGYARLDGFVLRPGPYALQPGMRVESLLSQDNVLPETYNNAGQVIRLFPPDYHPEVLYFDLGKALLKDPVHNIELKEFDVIRIFSRWDMEEIPKVRVYGEVQKPGDYRLYSNMRIRDLLMFAGNIKLTAYLKNAEITRLNRTGSAVTSFPITIDLGEAYNGKPEHNILLEPYDELVIRKIPNWADETDRYMTLKGEFVFPGVYPIFKGERLSSVIRRAGGFTSKAYLHGTKFTRVSARDLQQKRMDEFVASAELEVNSKMTDLAAVATSQEELASAKATLEGVRRNLQVLKSAKAEGRMVIVLKQPDTFAGSPDDVEVMGGDLLEVPQSSSAVSVLGRVYTPTSFIYQADRDVDYYLKQAGGATRDSDEDEIYLVRADGSVVSRQQFSTFNTLFKGGFLATKVNSGDAIVVPQKFEQTAVIRNIKDITAIMSQIAVSAGTVILGLKR